MGVEKSSMSYSERDGQVILTMSREDYDIVLMALGAFTAMTWNKTTDKGRMFVLLNDLNSGKPNYTPYQVEAHEKKS
jgi:hypothetical protein